MNFVKCTRAELSALQQFSRETFIDTFSAYNTAENMAAYLESAFSTRTLEKELDEAASAFFLAYRDGEIAGYIKINEAPAQTDINDSASLELERIYLRKDRRGAGEGKLLLDYAAAQAKDRRKSCLWLGVWEKNKAALSFYRKHGFYAFSAHDFWMGSDRQRDILMRLDLV